MKLVEFEPTSKITQHDSAGATIAGVARASGVVRIALLRLDAGGVVGMHPAVGPQLFLVVAGEGVVWVEAESRSITVSQAALWQDSELHETTTRSGLTAVIVEADAIELINAPQ